MEAPGVYEFMKTVIHQDHPVVREGQGGILAARRGAGARDQGPFPDPLGIVGRDDGMGARRVGAVAESPDDMPGVIQFDHPVVELIRDQHVAGLVEPVSGGGRPQTQEASGKGDQDGVGGEPEQAASGFARAKSKAHGGLLFKRDGG